VVSPGERLQAGRGARTVAALLAAAFLFAGCSEPDPSPAEAADPLATAPIIIVDIDTLRADHLGTYGYPRATSPALDAFAAEASVFEWAFAQGPNTPPSQASILTGLQPSRHGRISATDVLDETIPTLAEALAEAGFRTAAFVDGGFMHARFGMAQGFELYDDGADREAPRGVELIGPEVDAWLAENAEERFFLLIHTYDVHAPYENTPLPFRTMFLPGLSLPEADFRRRSHQIAEQRREWERRRASGEPTEGERPVVDPTQMDWLVGLYDGGIRHVDQWFAHLVERLRALGLYERAILVVVSDHGEAFGEHDLMDHHAIYSTVARVPLMIRLPGQPQHSRIDAVVQTVDLVPTLLDLVGVAPPGPSDGRSLAPLLRGESLPPLPAFTESPFHGSQTAVADQGFRILVTEEPNAVELFEIRSDPLEQRNVADGAAETRDRLGEAARRYQREVRSLYRPGGEEGAPELDPGLEKQLRGLGYIE
jgi:arylsulfatase A-like enzyme